MGRGHGAGPREAAAAPLPADSQAGHPISTYLRISTISGTCRNFQHCQGINPEQFLQRSQSTRKRDTQTQPSQCTARGRDVPEDEPEEGHTSRSSPGSCGHPRPCSPSSSSPRAGQDKQHRKNASSRGELPSMAKITSDSYLKGERIVFWHPVRLPQMDLPGWHRLDRGGIFRGFNFSAQVLLHANIHSHCFRRFQIC